MHHSTQFTFSQTEPRGLQQKTLKNDTEESTDICHHGLLKHFSFLIKYYFIHLQLRTECGSP